MVHSSTLLFAVLCTCCVGIANSRTYSDFLEEATRPDIFESLLKWRRELHMMPELFFSEVNTSQYIRSQLDEMGITYEFPFGITGIRAGPIGSSDENSPTIALRADMDGLPITEEVDVPYMSKTPGCMHACGHDAHMAMLLGAARLLQSRAASLPGRVVLLFQPAEEGGGGARLMAREGALRGVGAVHGLHVWPGLPAGVIGTRSGVIMAASDRFSFTVRGAGGHGALPHTARDPVVAGAAVVGALQALVSRETSPVDSAVVTVARFNTGPGAANVIPDSVSMSGTVRALTEDTFTRLHRRLEEVAAGVAGGYGCSIENVTWSDVPYPPTSNDELLSSLVREVASGLKLVEPSPSSPPRVQLVEPSMAAEDFSFYREVVPQTAFTFLGIGDPAKGTTVGLHSPRFQMDEQQLPLGAALHAAVAVEWLTRQQRRLTPGGSAEMQQGEQPASSEPHGTHLAESDKASGAAPDNAPDSAPDNATETGTATCVDTDTVIESASDIGSGNEGPAAATGATPSLSYGGEAVEGEVEVAGDSASASPAESGTVAVQGGEEDSGSAGGEDPRIAGLRVYARLHGVRSMPEWVRRWLKDDPEFAGAVAQADFEEGLRERLSKVVADIKARKWNREQQQQQQQVEWDGELEVAEESQGEAEVTGEPQESTCPHDEL